MHYYALTLRPLQTATVQEKLDMIDLEIEYLNTIVYPYPKTKFIINYEVDYKKNGNHNVHVHCTIHSTVKMYINKIMEHDNGLKKHFSYCLKKITEPVGWEKYRTKCGLRCHQDVYDQISQHEQAQKACKLRLKMSSFDKAKRMKDIKQSKRSFPILV